MCFLAWQRAPPGCPPQPAGGAEESGSSHVSAAWPGSAERQEPPVPGRLRWGCEALLGGLNSHLLRCSHGSPSAADSSASGRHHPAAGGGASATIGWS